MTSPRPGTLRGSLREHLDHLDAPAGDLDAARATGTRILRRRRARTASVLGGTAVAAVAALTIGLGALPGGPTGSDAAPAAFAVAPLGPLDFSGGLRAYASPDGSETHLGGRTFTDQELAGLDTDAAATAQGVVYYDDGQPVLLDASGDSRALEAGAATGGSFAPTSKADSDGRTVAYGAVLDGSPTVVVRDLADDTVVATREVGASTVIDALDGGVVALRDDTGTTLWDTATDSVAPLAGARTRVADLRSGVLLYDGARPDGPAASDYRLVAGGVDAQLTFDGAHVVSGWSGTLVPTTEGGRPITLDRGPSADGYAFWTVDTDGSVLVAVPKGRTAAVYDCAVPSGTCETLDPLRVVGGDPVFVGNDM